MLFSFFPQQLTPQNANEHRQHSRKLLCDLNYSMKKIVENNSTLLRAYHDADSFLENFYLCDSPKTLNISLKSQKDCFIFHLEHEQGSHIISGDIYFYGQGTWNWRFKYNNTFGTQIESYQGLGERWSQEDRAQDSAFIFSLPQEIEKLLSFEEIFSFIPTPLYHKPSSWKQETNQLHWLWSESYYDGPITGYGMTPQYKFLKIEQIQELEYSRKRLYSLKKVNFYESIRIRLSRQLFLYEYDPKNKKRNKMLLYLIKKLRQHLHFSPKYFQDRKIIGYYIIE